MRLWFYSQAFLFGSTLAMMSVLAWFWVSALAQVIIPASPAYSVVVGFLALTITLLQWAIFRWIYYRWAAGIVPNAPPAGEIPPDAITLRWWDTTAMAIACTVGVAISCGLCFLAFTQLLEPHPPLVTLLASSAAMPLWSVTAATIYHLLDYLDAT